MKENEITRLLEASHCDRKARLEQLPILSRYMIDGHLPQFHRKDIKLMLAGGPHGELSAKLLHVIGLLNGLDKCAELVARLLFTASNAKELENAVSFSLTLSPIFPSVVTLGVGYLVSNIPQLTAEIQEEKESEKFTNGCFLNLPAHFSADTIWLKNLLTLISWQKHAPEDSLLNCLGLNLADLKGDLQAALFNWALSYIDQLNQGSGWDQHSTDVFVCFLDLLKVVCPKAQLQIRVCNRLIVLFSALVVSLLRLVTKESFGDSFDGVDMVCHCYAIAGLFFTSQQSADKSLLIRSLLNDVFENSVTIFGTKKKLSCIGSEISFIKLPLSLLSGQDLDEFSFLKALRSSSQSIKTAHNFAHTGQLRKRDKEIRNDAQEETKLLRIFLFTNMIEIICMKYGNQILSQKQCKSLGQKLVEQFCSDGLTLGFGWNDWDWEREELSRYIEISKKLEETPFINNFLTIVAGTGSGVWFALPLLRARFIHLLSELEKTILKDAKVSRQNLDVIAFIFSVFAAASFIPDTLIATFDIICLSTNHEAYVILMSFWKLIQSRWPAEGDASTDIPLTDAFLLCEPSGVLFIEMVILVGQRHVSDAKPSFSNLVNLCCSYYVCSLKFSLAFLWQDEPQFGTLGGSAPQVEQLSSEFNSIWRYDGEKLRKEEEKRTCKQPSWNLNKFDIATRITLPFFSKERRLERMKRPLNKSYVKAPKEKRSKIQK